MMVVRILVRKRIKAAKIPCKFISTVHDSIVVDTPKEYLQLIVDIFHKAFEDAPSVILAYFGYVWKVPMDCECKFGMNMKEMTKIKPSWA